MRNAKKAFNLQGSDLASNPDYGGHRSNRIFACSTLLSDAPPLMVETLSLEALGYVVDIPATKDGHHTGEYGLINHSLETAERALTMAQSVPFSGSRRRRDRIIAATWFQSLVQFLGQAYEVQVLRQGAIWDPSTEPLEMFYERHGRSGREFRWPTQTSPAPREIELPAFQHFLGLPALWEYVGKSLLLELEEKQSRDSKLMDDCCARAHDATCKAGASPFGSRSASDN